jgi:hypothetical protein
MPSLCKSQNGEAPWQNRDAAGPQRSAEGRRCGARKILLLKEETSNPLDALLRTDEEPVTFDRSDRPKARRSAMKCAHFLRVVRRCAFVK